MSLTINVGVDANFRRLNFTGGLSPFVCNGTAKYELLINPSNASISGSGSVSQEYWENTNALEGIEKLDFNTDTGIAIPGWKEGRIVYDYNHKCHVAFNDKSDVGLCIGRESYARVKNNTGSTILNGTAVYISSADPASNLAVVEKADKNAFDKSRLLGVATMDIAGSGGTGYATINGDVNNVDTSTFTIGDVIYLGDNGAIINTRPTDGDFPVVLGTVLKVGTTDGIIFILPDIPQYTAEVVQTTGWANVQQYTMSFDDGTRTLTMSTVGSEFRFYQAGIKYEKTSDSIAITDQEGLHFIYYNNGTLVDLYNPTFDQIAVIIRTNPNVAYVYWDQTNSKHIYLGNEEHTISMPGATHVYLHVNEGARYVNGLDATDVLADQAGTLDTHAQFGITGGSTTDEDVPTFINGIASTVGTPIYYYSGPELTRTVRQTINAGFAVATTGTGRLAYNQLTGGNWQLTEAGDNNYVLCHVFGLNDAVESRKLISAVGINQYTSATLAEQGAEDEIREIMGGQVLTPELVPLYTFIFNTKNTYSNSVKARIVSTTEGDYFDWRRTSLAGGGGGGGAVNPVFADDVFTVFSSGDVSKEVGFDVSGVTTSTKRLIGAPNHNLTLPASDGTTGDVVETNGSGVQSYRGVGPKTTTVSTATYTVLAADEALQVTRTTTGACVITVPSALITAAKKEWTITDAGDNASFNNVTIETEGSQTINGFSNYTINSDKTSITLYSDTSNLFIK
jgi:hypothetical protein